MIERTKSEEIAIQIDTDMLRVCVKLGNLAFALIDETEAVADVDALAKMAKKMRKFRKIIRTHMHQQEI